MNTANHRRGTRLATLLLVSTGVAALAGAAAAQQTSSTPLGTLKVEGQSHGDFAIQTRPDTGYAATVSVGANRTETALVDTPQAITVVTRDQLKDLGLQSMADVVRYVPGVNFAQGEGNRDALMFRGLASTADFFTDGIRDDVQYYRDVYNVERVEVVKGPNAMVFGRGGSGGLINRITRQAGWDVQNELALEAGSQDHYRATVDYNHVVDQNLALRVTGLWQDSGSYRNSVTYEKFGVNPTASLRLSDQTLVQIGYEHFEDRRVADRGVSANAGGALANPARPLSGYRDVFFGDPGRSPTSTDVDAFNVAVEHHFANGMTLRNRTRVAEYDKFYQNVFPGEINPTLQTVRISAYNNFTNRENLFNQTDLIFYADTGSIRHTLLAGAEFGRQKTTNFRETGQFAGGATSVNAPLSNPTVDLPITWVHGANDASNAGVVKVAAGYIQDQIELTSKLQAVVGVRYEHIASDVLNRNTNARIETTDDLWSPRAGLIFKPADNLSFYGSYTKTYLPRSGEQLASLAANNATLKPEIFDNYEVGAKWDAIQGLSLTAAVYQLDRKNTAITDPADPLNLILVDGQRSRGVELSAAGQITAQWSVIAAYAYQEAEIKTRQSTTILAGNRIANVPEQSASVWTRYDVTPQFGAGLGVIYQGARFTAADNVQEMPDYTRVDAALFYAVNDRIDLQLNVENLLDADYFATAHSNNNITPGGPRAFRVGLTTRF